MSAHFLGSGILCTLLMVASTGCQVLRPIPIEVKEQYIAPELVEITEPQFESGRPNRLIDGIGEFFGFPSKLLLWDTRIDNHRISDDTLLSLANYLEHNNLPHVKVRANQYAPLDEWRRLKKNKTVSPWIRYTVGTLSVAQGAILPGRIFGGDHFNPYTQSIHLYSDVPSVALHEGGHAKDFTRRKYQGTYALAYGILPIWHETLATEDVYAYLETTGDEAMLAEADRILYPAYGTYVGGALGNFSPANSLPIYLGTTALGHLNGRMLTRQRKIAKAESGANSETIRLVSGESPADKTSAQSSGRE
ncbi:MAG: hypothetical protein AAFX06_09625 [Planctomycetota bacterium]